jgi:uncharacterized damage-inducible protein DinB
MAERDRIVDQMKRSREGDAWHGPAVREVLEGITWEKAVAKPIPAAHSIFEIVLHMTAWEDIVRRRLLGESVSPTPNEDWPPVTDPGKAAWDRALKALEAGNMRLRKTAAGIDDALLDSPPVAKASSRYILLHGIIQHSLYHAGQIAVLKKA